MHDFLPSSIVNIRKKACKIAESTVAPNAGSVDRDCKWPEQSLRALASAGLTGLHVPKKLGGHEQGLLALAVMCETIGKACPSTALCFGMHCVGTAVIAVKATPEQEERFLGPIAEGRHLTTLALSESGTGAHFYLPGTTLKRRRDRFVVNGTKLFVTNGGNADSYVISTKASTSNLEIGEFNCLIVEGDRPGIRWLEPWRGVGMRGNSSRGMQLDGVSLPVGNLLGREGDQIWYIFEVVAPYFLVAMAGTYLGIAQAALDIAISHLRERKHDHSGERLADNPVLQHKLSEVWTSIERTRCLIYKAAQLGDLNDRDALTPILNCKVAAAETSVYVTNEAMTLCGGMTYRENSKLAQLLRDARAAHVMSPTTDLLKQWAGRSLLGLPLL